MTKVASTIVLSNEVKTTFLVDGSEPFHFLSVDKMDNKTALATTLAYLRETVGINVECLRLEELSITLDSEKQSLFVFSIHDRADEIIKQCQNFNHLKFVDVSQLHHLFETVEMDTAPFFE